MNWEERKKLAWERILVDKEIGYLDPDIYEVLEAFFKRPKSYTKSSCSGRIIIIDSLYPWQRKNSTIIYKNHFGIKLEILEDIVNKPHEYMLWLLVQSPIIHVYTFDYDEAWEVLKIARAAGFKHSGILVHNENGILVEIRSGIGMIQLLKDKNGKVVSDLKAVTVVANDILAKGKEKLNKLKQHLLSEVNYSMKLREDSKG
ncbi:MAG: hypothetical protein QXV69_01710 [Sulfolobaceae archaeon]